MNAFSPWKPEAVRVTEASDDIVTYNKTPNSARRWCKRCGGHLFTQRPGMELTDVHAAVVPGLEFKRPA